MANRNTYFRVGLFVLASMTLIAVAVVALGIGAAAGKSTIKAETYVDTSVQGLEPGSKVRNSGVEIGLVDEISFVDTVYDIDPTFLQQRGGRGVLLVDRRDVLAVGDTLGRGGRCDERRHRTSQNECITHGCEAPNRRGKRGVLEAKGGDASVSGRRKLPRKRRTGEPRRFRKKRCSRVYG